MRCSSGLLLLLLPCWLACCAPCWARRSVRTYTIDLDLPPARRYDALVGDAANGFNATVWKFWDGYFARDAALRDVLYGIAEKRGPENAEMAGEIDGLAAASGLPRAFVKGVQLLYELQTIMVPIVNFTGAPVDGIPEGYEALARIPWRGPGCTGIVARNTDPADGSVWHARNLDFAPVPIMTNLVYNAVFKKGGKELFKMQMIAGYTQAITGFRPGADGFAIERNTRYTDHWGGNAEMLRNVESGRELNGWQLRKVFEEEATYDAAVARVKSMPYASTEYAIMSGVNKGTIISRNPDDVAYVQTLGQPNFEEKKDYLIITNFDFFFHDIREHFDPTGGGGFAKPSRRVAAQTILNASTHITPQVLFDTINAEYVIADTVFQAIINVEKGVWNISQPDLM
jgi:hypothetical protein